MITLADGLNGAGKTEYIVSLLYKEWQAGAEIYSNIPLYFSKNNERVHYWSNLQELYNVKNGIIFIDEAQRLLDNRRWASLPTEFSEKLAQHRKHGLDVYTTTPNINHIDLRLKNLVARWFRCESILRIPGNQRLKPIVQLVFVYEMFKKEDAAGRLIKYYGKRKWRWIGRWWTRRLYDTYGDVGLSHFLTKAKICDKKMKVVIASRELINRGKVRF